MTGATAQPGKNLWYEAEYTRRGGDLDRWFAHWNYRANIATASGMGTLEITPTGDFVPTFYWQDFNVATGNVADYCWIAEIEEKK